MGTVKRVIITSTGWDWGPRVTTRSEHRDIGVFSFFFLFYTVGRSIRSTASYFSAALCFLNGSNGDGSFFYYLLYLFACHSCNSYGVYRSSLASTFQRSFITFLI
jgi:hypothetical protein